MSEEATTEQTGRAQDPISNDREMNLTMAAILLRVAQWFASEATEVQRDAILADVHRIRRYLDPDSEPPVDEGEAD